MEIGKYQTLTIAGKNKNGLSLTDGTQEVHLPFYDVPKNLETGDSLRVFVYRSKEGQFIATSREAKGEVHQFCFLKVLDTGEDGAYLDLGIDKDVFVPKREQKRPMLKGNSYVVYLYLDAFDRLTASSRLDQFTDSDTAALEEGEEVSLLIGDESDLGYNAIIEQRYIGLLYRNEIFTDLEPGQQKRGWIKKIREEGKIDLSLQPTGYGHILGTKELIYAALETQGGLIKLGDKSSPEAIYARFQISKSAFKKAIGGLYKERKIEVGDFEIRRVN